MSEFTPSPPPRVAKPSEIVDVEPDEDSDYSIFDASSSAGEAGPIATRPRFQGSRQRGKRLIQAEIDLVEGLEQLENDDLAAHLYNAHALKSQFYAPQPSRSEIKPFHRKRRWVAVVDKQEWVPRTAWTAWPLELEMVDKQEKRFYRSELRANARSSRVIEPPKSSIAPSSQLADSLHSEILRQSRLRFYEAYGRELGGDTAQKTRKLNDEEESVASDFQFTTGAAQPGTGESGVQQSGPKIMILADEEEAERMAQPVVRHIIAKFEDLLDNLHASRRNHFLAERRGTQSESASDYESSDTSRSPSSYSRPSETFPRDWSEVLGLAMMTGWNPTVIDRAKGRCSSLFYESMDFEALPEVGSKSGMRTPPPDTQDSVLPVVDFARMICPVTACRRHRLPYQSRWRLNEHLKREHGYKISLRDQQTKARARDKMHGGVHVDGFLQPIVAPSRRKSSRVTEPKSDTRAPREDLESRDESDRVESPDVQLLETTGSEEDEQMLSESRDTSSAPPDRRSQLKSLRRKNRSASSESLHSEMEESESSGG